MLPGRSVDASRSHSRAGSRASGSRSLRIVALGGGTGLPAVLDGLCAQVDEAAGAPSDSVTAVVTVTDDGGSSGRLRRDLGVLPPGDARNCLAAVINPDSPFRRLLQHRFEGAPGLDGHTVGNLLLAALSQITGDFPTAVETLGELVRSRARVLPATRENVRLRAQMASGEIRVGETNIVAAKSGIHRLSLEPSARPVPEVLRALVNADGIVVGPGSLYTSVLPNLLVEGIAATLSAVPAIRIYVANLMTEPGETDGYSLDDHLQAIRTHTGYDLFDYVLVNEHPPAPPVAGRYAAQGGYPVVANGPLRWAGRAHVVRCDFVPDCTHGKVRHHPEALARTIRSVIRQGRTDASATVTPEG
jgi:uncharacterized cofD-like protein